MMKYKNEKNQDFVERNQDVKSHQVQKNGCGFVNVIDGWGINFLDQPYNPMPSGESNKGNLISQIIGTHVLT